MLVLLSDSATTSFRLFLLRVQLAFISTKLKPNSCRPTHERSKTFKFIINISLKITHGLRVVCFQTDLTDQGGRRGLPDPRRSREKSSFKS